MVSFERLTEEMEDQLRRTLYHQEIEFLKWVYHEHKLENSQTPIHNNRKKLHC